MLLSGLLCKQAEKKKEEEEEKLVKKLQEEVAACQHLCFFSSLLTTRLIDVLALSLHGKTIAQCRLGKPRFGVVAQPGYFKVLEASTIGLIRNKIQLHPSQHQLV